AVLKGALAVEEDRAAAARRVAGDAGDLPLLVDAGGAAEALGVGGAEVAHETVGVAEGMPPGQAAEAGVRGADHQAGVVDPVGPALRPAQRGQLRAHFVLEYKAARLRDRVQGEADDRAGVVDRGRLTDEAEVSEDAVAVEEGVRPARDGEAADDL